ncbi:MFS transporter [Acidisoma cellulosilytica]|uniref:MFS transporter n=1 Tax=Acidisoma cellulosilyticum TaxID=2802395 RepID=A0A963Z5V2_9PROT|nr:MFS transporter [Acidisoma cellulosilyticum]MCB8883101.1 MFS transporter [Acidisoma cellulosilyticum]
MLAEAYTDGVPVPQRYLAVLTIGLAVMLAVMDGAIANVALPTIARDLHASPASSIWVINGYQLAATISLLPLGSLGEIVGYRRVYIGGLVIFTLASLACALSQDLLVLALSRALQGFGAAGIMSVNAALTRFVYPRALLGRGMGINALVAATSAAAGPSIAAAILSVGPWPFLFAVNVPLGLIAFLVALRALPPTPLAKHRFDFLSAFMNAVMMASFIFALEGLAHGQRAVLILVEFAVCTAFGVLLVRRQANHVAPLLPLDLLRIPLFRLSAATAVCSFVAQMLAFTSLPFYIENSLGLTAVQTGLLMTPWPLATIVSAPIAGRLADRYPAGVLGGVGLSLLAIGLAAMAMLPANPSRGEIIWRMALCGAGFGLFQSPNNRTLMTSAPSRRSGGAAGTLGTSRLLGQTVGATLVALAFNALPRQGVLACLVAAATVAALAAAVSSSRLLLRAEVQ